MARLRLSGLAAAWLLGLAVCPVQAARLMHGVQPAALPAQEIARRLELRRGPGAMSPAVTTTSRDPRIVGEAFAGALEAMSAAVLGPMMGDPPDAPAGLRMFGEKLWEAMMHLLPEDQRGSDAVLQAKSDWDFVFKAGPAASIGKDVKVYDTTGNTDKLVRAMLSMVKVAMGGSGWALPQYTKCLAAVADLIEGLGEAWSMHSSGKLPEAMEVVWLAVRTAVEEAIDVNVTTGTYEVVLDAVDGPMADFSRQISDLKRAHLISKVCYKQKEPRIITRPSKCRDGFEWDGESKCIPDSKHGANCLQPCGGQAGPCPNFCGQGKVCCKQGQWFEPKVCKGATGYVSFDFTKGNSRSYHQCVTPKNKLPVSLAEVQTQQLDSSLVGKKKKPVNGHYDAECESPSAERQGDWCFNACRKGFVAIDRECEQVCDGPFPANAFGMCSTSTMDFNVATLEMEAIASNSEWSRDDLLSELNFGDTGVDPNKLSKTIDAFLAMGEAFPRPTCPDLTDGAATGSGTPATARKPPKAMHEPGLQLEAKVEARLPELGPRSRPRRPKV